MHDGNAVWTADDSAALLELLAIDTTTPMETALPSAIGAAQQFLAHQAARLGFEAVHFAAPAPPVAEDNVPLPVLARLREFGPAFLAWQPNLVLRLGPARPPEHCIVFNVHIDTVAPFVAPRVQGGIVAGRGVADAKGLVIAVLAGVRRALAADPALLARSTILLQSPAGEEGGAMGVYGTRTLVRAGFWGRLNIICEPTGMAATGRTTASMTARIEVAGAGSTDDDPFRGENASILLGALASDLARELAPALRRAGGRLCIGGLCTGHTHNRVFGDGVLLANIAYFTTASGDAFERMTECWFQGALTRFTAAFADIDIAAATARAAGRITRLIWEKKGLPVLDNADPLAEALLRSAGIETASGPGAPVLTCDAMWFQHPDSYACVLGPGDLGANGAHTPHEFLAIADLDAFAQAVSRICRAFAGAAPSV